MGRLWSLPSWERGLKLELDLAWMDPVMVAPLVGAWIEMTILAWKSSPSCVAPLVGAWIEIRSGLFHAA